MPAKREWVCDYTDSCAHPQMQQAGFWGMTVFRELTRISGQFSLEGLLPPYYAQPEFIARRLMTDDVTAVRDGVTACVTARLLLPEGDSYRMDGWDRRQPSMPMTPAERKAKSREAKKNQVVTEVSHETSRDVTPVVDGVTNVTLREEKRREEKRVEEKRVEETTTSPAAAQPEPVAVPVPEVSKAPKTKPVASELPPLRVVEATPHQLLLGALVAVFEVERGVPYAVDGGRDGKAVKWLLEHKVPDTEALRRWKAGLNGKFKQRIDCIHELASRWNALGGNTGAAKDLTKGYAAADDCDWSGDGGYGALNAKRGAK